MKFKESALAHKYLDGLNGIEIGGSAHNPFNIRGGSYQNVDYTNDPNTIFKQEEVKLCGTFLPVNIVAEGDKLPFEDNSLDYILSSHVIEHFWHPFTALREWYRVIKPGGYIYCVCPHKERTFDKDRPRTTLQELINRPLEYNDKEHRPDAKGHNTVWITEDMLEVCKYLGYNVVEYLDVDDKVSNGFVVIITK